MVDLFAEAYTNHYDLTNLIQKTEVIFQPVPGEPYVESHLTRPSTVRDLNWQVPVPWKYRVIIFDDPIWIFNKIFLN